MAVLLDCVYACLRVCVFALCTVHLEIFKPDEDERPKSEIYTFIKLVGQTKFIPRYALDTASMSQPALF